MIIALLTVGFLMVGLIGGTENHSEQARSLESPAKIASETAIQIPTPAPIELPLAIPNDVVKSTVPLRVLMTAEEAPARQEEQKHADTIDTVAPLGGASGGSAWIENDDNFDEWAK